MTWPSARPSPAGTAPRSEPLIGYFVNMLVLRGPTCRDDPSFLELLGQRPGKRHLRGVRASRPTASTGRGRGPPARPATLSRTPLFPGHVRAPEQPLARRRPAMTWPWPTLHLRGGGRHCEVRPDPRPRGGQRAASSGSFEYEHWTSSIASTIDRHRSPDFLHPPRRGRQPTPIERLSSTRALPDRGRAVRRRSSKRETSTGEPSLPKGVPTSHQPLRGAQAERTPDAIALSLRLRGAGPGRMPSSTRRASSDGPAAGRARGIRRGDRSSASSSSGRSRWRCGPPRASSRRARPIFPLDPAYPSRAAGHFMLDDSGLKCRPHSESSREIASGRELPDPQVVRLDRRFEASFAGEVRRQPGRRGIRSEDPAYVIYTSGSTGRPRGGGGPPSRGS